MAIAETPSGMVEAPIVTLEHVIETTKMQIGGLNDVSVDLAPLITIIIKAYGNEPDAFLLIRPTVPKSDHNPPAAIMYHPRLNIVVFSQEPYEAQHLQRKNADELYVTRKGKRTDNDILDKCERLRIDVQYAVANALRRTKKELSVNLALVLPEISIAEWKSHKLGHDTADGAIFVSEDIESVADFQDRLEALIKPETTSVKLTPKQSRNIRKVFSDNSVINDVVRQPRDLGKDGSSTLGLALDEMYSLERTLSEEQQMLSRIDIAGVPRLIRGVAGSGKSVVLANIIARYITRTGQKSLFDKTEKPRIAVICFNRALVAMLRGKIEAAYKEQTGENLLSDRMVIKHINGLLYQIGNDYQGITYIPVNRNVPDDAAKRADQYRKQLADLQESQPDYHASLLFDAIFIDEGQDLSQSEYQLLMDLTRTDPSTGEKTFVIFYDDAQNLYARPRPNWKQVGVNIVGGRSTVMRQCFRNTRPIVEMAFNVLLGTYSADKTVQSRTFADIAYLKQIDAVDEKENGHVHVNFTKRMGPPPHTKTFSSRQEEVRWIVRETLRLLTVEKVRSEDILILFRSDKEYQDLFEEILSQDTQNLLKGFVKPYGQREDCNTFIFRPDYLTVSTVNGAKGYDAMVVFLIGIDQYRDTPKDRATFYVGATRAKIALYLTGIADKGPLLQEAQTAIKLQ